MALGQRGKRGFIQLWGTGVFPNSSKTSQSFPSTSNTAEPVPRTGVELHGSTGQVLTTEIKTVLSERELCQLRRWQQELRAGSQWQAQTASLCKHPGKRSFGAEVSEPRQHSENESTFIPGAAPGQTGPLLTGGATQPPGMKLQHPHTQPGAAGAAGHCVGSTLKQHFTSNAQLVQQSALRLARAPKVLFIFFFKISFAAQNNPMHLLSAR